MVKLKVSGTRLSNEPISKFVFGNFIEDGLGRQTDGMWAEMLFNRSFQERTPFNENVWNALNFTSANYNDNAAFWHNGYEECDWELLAPGHSSMRRTLGSNSFKGKSSLEIKSDGLDCNAGICQKNIFMKKGEVYTFSLFGGYEGKKVSRALSGFEQIDDECLKAKEVKLVLRESSRPGRVLFSRILEFECLQKRFDVEIMLHDYTGMVTLEISFDWKGSILLSWASLMPVRNVRGWDEQVVGLLKKVAPTVLRFPGGCFASFFNWRDGIGPRDGRTPMESHYWGGLDENDVGIDEFLDLCHELKCEPQICVNMMNGTPFNAAELVEYCNGRDDSRMGGLRRLNGVERENRVVLWEMDNEAGRKWSALQYAEEVVKFAAAMKNIDPDIKLMMEFYSFGLEWLPQMLEIAGRHIDLAIHRSIDKSFISEAIGVLREYNRINGTSILYANTEWLADPNAPEPFPDREIPQYFDWEGEVQSDDRKNSRFRMIRWFYTLNAASNLLDFLSCGGEFYLANFNNCVNTWGGNIIEASKEGAWLSPAGHVMSFFAGSNDKYPLTTELEQDGVVDAKVLACEIAGGNGINIYIVNPGTEELLLEVEADMSYKACQVRTLFAPDRLSRATISKSDISLDVYTPESESLFKIKPLSVSKISYSN